MFVINISNSITLILLLAITLLLIILAKEIKKSLIVVIPLCTFLILLVIHVIQIIMIGSGIDNYSLSTLAKCVTVDFIFIFISFISYLWIDDIEARATKKKSIDNSLDWFWDKV